MHDRESIKKLIPILQAYADGRTIEWNDCGTWREIELLDLNNQFVEYRVQPLKRENDAEKYLKLMREGKKILFHQWHNWHEVKDEEMLIRLSKQPYVDFKVAKE